MEDTRWRLPHGVLPSHVSDIRGKGIGVSHHHITRASPVDDTHAEVSQDSFLQRQVRERAPLTLCLTVRLKVEYAVLTQISVSTSLNGTKGRGSYPAKRRAFGDAGFLPAGLPSAGPPQTHRSQSAARTPLGLRRCAAAHCSVAAASPSGVGGRPPRATPVRTPGRV